MKDFLLRGGKENSGHRTSHSQCGLCRCSAHLHSCSVILVGWWSWGWWYLTSPDGCFETRQEDVRWLGRAHSASPQSQTRGLRRGSDIFLPVADVLSPGSQQAQVERRQLLATPKSSFGQAFLATCSTATYPHLLKVNADRPDSRSIRAGLKCSLGAHRGLLSKNSSVPFPAVEGLLRWIRAL